MNGFVQVPHVLLRSGLDPIVLRVYLVMASHGGRDGVCTASRETVASESGCSGAAVKRALAELVALGLVSVELRPGRSSWSRVVRPRDAFLARGSGRTDPGSGRTDPGSRVTQTPEGDEDKKIKEGEVNTDLPIGGRLSDAQKRLLRDSVLAVLDVLSLDVDGLLEAEIEYLESAAASVVERRIASWVGLQSRAMAPGADVIDDDDRLCELLATHGVEPEVSHV